MTINFNNGPLEITPNDNSVRVRSIMGEHTLTLHYALAQHVEIPLGAWVEYEGVRYELKEPQHFKKNGRRNFEYTLTLKTNDSHPRRYKVRNVVDGRLKFSLTATPREHLRQVVDNMNKRESGWVLGDCIVAAEKVISYNFTSCSEALQMIAEAFETEWEIVGKTIHLRKIEYNKNSPLTLKFGNGNGLLPGTGRVNSSESKQIEILHVQGGSQNIDPSKYGGRELLLPKDQLYTYNGRWYRTSADGFSVYRQGKSLQTRAEGSLDLTHIYPKRVGSISKVTITGKGFCDIADSSIPDSLNYESCLIAGETMTVIFQTGMLAGKEFEVKYLHASRTFQIIEQEIDGVPMPKGGYIPKVGDKYAVFNIMLPDAYICDKASKTGASWDMLKEAVKFLYENEDAKFTYSGELDGMFTKDKWLEIGGKIRLGGYVSLSDDDYLQTPELVRIISIRDYPTKPHKPKIELSNGVVGGTVGSELDKLGGTEVEVEKRYEEALKFTKRRWRDAQESLGMIGDLMDSFNEDIGSLRDEMGDIQFTPPITPITIQTMALLIGDPSLQYTAGTLRVTYDIQTKVLSVTGSFIAHQTLGKAKVLKAGNIAGGKAWISSSFTSPPLTDTSKAYYLYLRASKTSTSAIGFLSEKPQSFAGDADAYNLLVGILSSEYDGERSFAKLYGFMEILPGRITADEMIIQADKTTIADAAGNQVAIFSGIYGGLAELINVRINGFIQQKWHTQTFNSAHEIVDLSFSYNVILNRGYSGTDAAVIKLPYDDKYNGVVFRLLATASTGISINRNNENQKIYSTQPVFTTKLAVYGSSWDGGVQLLEPGGTLGPQYFELLQVTKNMIIVLKAGEATLSSMSGSKYGA